MFTLRRNGNLYSFLGNSVVQRGGTKLLRTCRKPLPG